MQIFDATGTFTPGATTSTKIFPGGAVPYNLQLPDAGWIAANISFLVSIDGVSYQPLYRDDVGAENQYVITSTGTGAKAYYIDGNKFAGCRGIQVVSSVAQTTGCIVKLGMRDLT